MHEFLKRYFTIPNILNYFFKSSTSESDNQRRIYAPKPTPVFDVNKLNLVPKTLQPNSFIHESFNPQYFNTKLFDPKTKTTSQPKTLPKTVSKKTMELATLNNEPWRRYPTTLLSTTTTTAPKTTFTTSTTTTAATTVKKITPIVTKTVAETTTLSTTTKLHPATNKIADHIPFVNRTMLIDDNCMKCLCFVSLFLC